MMNNPKERQQWITDELKLNPLLLFKDCFSKYLVRFGKTEVTFSKDWKTAQSTHKEYQIKLNKAKDDVSIDLELKAVKNGLKSKLDRLMFYQNQIDVMNLQLIGDVRFTFIVGNKQVESHNENDEFVLPIEKQNEIRKQIKDYQTEISKIEGDYAVLRTDMTTNGKSLNENLTSDQMKEKIAELLAKRK